MAIKISIRMRLLLAATISIFCMSLLVATDMYTVRKDTKTLDTLYDMQVLSPLLTIDSTLKEVRFRMAGYVLDQLPAAGNKNQIVESRTIIPAAWKKYEQKSGDSPLGQADMLAAKKLSDHFSELDQFLARLQTAYDADNKQSVSDMLENDWPIIQMQVIKPLDRLIPLQQAAVKRTYQASVSTSQRLLRMMGFVMAAGLTLVLAFTWHLTRAIARPLDTAVKIAGKIAGGDLTSRITVRANDETGQLMHALKQMNERLLATVGEVRASVDAVATATQQIVTGNGTLTDHSQMQTEKLTDTARAVATLVDTVKTNTDHARQAHTLTRDAREVARVGDELIQSTVGTMTSIKDSSDKVARITDLIDDIAFQTNVLALNAAIEAARAGQQGKGFGVVAVEVRNLAQRAASSAAQIKELVDDTVSRIETGSRQVTDAGQTMRVIVDSVNRMTEIMENIFQACELQNHEIEQISNAMTRMEDATRHNAALAVETSATAEELSGQAQALSRAVGIFRLNDTSAPQAGA